MICFIFKMERALETHITLTQMLTSGVGAVGGVLRLPLASTVAVERALAWTPVSLERPTWRGVRSQPSPRGTERHLGAPPSWWGAAALQGSPRSPGCHPSASSACDTPAATPTTEHTHGYSYCCKLLIMVD